MPPLLFFCDLPVCASALREAMGKGDGVAGHHYHFTAKFFTIGLLGL
ncbi:hypothetical protein CLV36_11720 [Laceyella sediminis]|uniref:Uncharacterized protein n=1 Tax=Laceyella sediminis TaxID=573074 RepID=A0ABX5EJX0_9BACL|nr:hypothetical protein CLV36_11720 [Laceyella sediminis]